MSYNLKALVAQHAARMRLNDDLARAIMKVNEVIEEARVKREADNKVEDVDAWIKAYKIKQSFGPDDQFKYRPRYETRRDGTSCDWGYWWDMMQP